tara:strand:- start:218 stop:931 length:714 start_codon:yes stop_codon:yes gene_type:complete
MKLNKTVKKEALLHAQKDSPRESVGLVHIVKGRQKYYPCNNLAETPDEHFVLDPIDYVECEKKGEIVGIIHSHPITNHHPSSADLVACEKSGLPWFIVNPKTELWGECKPSGYELPYVGRYFFHGIVDCYTLLQDFYKKEFGIKMGDYHRRDKWWEKGENMYLDNFKKEGMREVDMDELKYGDILFMKLESEVPNHGAIYLGDMIILHHVQGRLSSRDVYGGYYQKVTELCLRHESR